MTKPNILLILTDQLRAHALGCYGNTQIKTPNIDALAGESLRFDQAVTNCPVCMPARSALLAGQYTRRCTGALNNHHLIDEKGMWYIPDPPEKERSQLVDKVLPEYLKDLGYYNKLIGKWHIHPEPRLLGFDSWCYPLMYHRYYHQCFFDDDKGYVVDEFTPFFEVDKFKEFLTKRKGPDPFFCFYNISLPHMPLSQMPDKYKGLYDADSLTLRPNVESGGETADKHWFNVYMRKYILERRLPVPDSEVETMDIHKLTALYYSLVTITDHIVGELVKELKEKGLYENTLILFTSDHGDMLGSHGLYNKEQLYEESIRVPLLIKASDIKPGVNTEQIAQMIDIMPTLLDYMGIAVPQHTDGQSLMPILRGHAQTLEKNVAFIECNNYKMGIRTPKYTYGIQVDPNTMDVKDDALQFHDLVNDPYQQNDLSENRPDALNATAEALRDRVITWHKETPWLKNPCRYYDLSKK